MEILPAIDIKDGQVVRLYQGDYGQVTTFPDSVSDTARRWQAAGARWLHVVDLDGARAGHPVNSAAILTLRQVLSCHVEVGGGLRTRDQIARLLDAGIDRVILGTAALADPALVEWLLARNPDALGIALDARDGVVATAGWLGTSGQRAEVVAQQWAARGVRWFSHTDIARDGALRGPNLDALAAVRAALHTGAATQGAVGPLRLIAAGGIASLADIRALRELGLDGAIVGRALYNGAIDLAAALRVAREQEESDA